jgi:hypothetical protein
MPQLLLFSSALAAAIAWAIAQAKHEVGKGPPAFRKKWRVRGCKRHAAVGKLMREAAG